ncbi:hypothetical protein ACET55_19030, partial [Aeromonas caviae]
EGGNINMMHGDSRVMVVVCLATTSLPAPCLSTSTFPGSREEPYFMRIEKNHVNEILEAPNQGRATTRPSVKL